MRGCKDGGEVEGYCRCEGNGGLAEAEGGFGQWIFLGAEGEIYGVMCASKEECE